LYRNCFLGNNPAGVVISNIVSQGEELWATAVEGGFPMILTGTRGRALRERPLLKRHFQPPGKPSVWTRQTPAATLLHSWKSSKRRKNNGLWRKAPQTARGDSEKPEPPGSSLCRPFHRWGLRWQHFPGCIHGTVRKVQVGLADGPFDLEDL
jgi:hypothetical protein